RCLLSSIVVGDGIYTPCPKRGSGRRRRSAVSGHEIHFPSLRPRSIPLPRPTPVCLRNPPHLGKIGPVTTAYRREQSFVLAELACAFKGFPDGGRPRSARHSRPG